jgi:hypothetical protein
VGCGGIWWDLAGGIWWDLVVGSFDSTRSRKLVESVVEFDSTNFPNSPPVAVQWWKSVESTKFYCRVYLMKRSKWGLAAWCLGTRVAGGVCFGLGTNYPCRNMPSSTRYNGSTGFGRYSPLGGAGDGSAGGASHLPTRVVPSSSIDRARQDRARSGLRTKRS